MMKEWGYHPLPAHVEPNESPVKTPGRWREYPLILNTGAKQPMYWHSRAASSRPAPAEYRTLAEIHPETAVKLDQQGRLRLDRDRARQTAQRVHAQ